VGVGIVDGAMSVLEAVLEKVGGRVAVERTHGPGIRRSTPVLTSVLGSAPAAGAAAGAVVAAVDVADPARLHHWGSD
jgi:hypothetical protein